MLEHTKLKVGRTHQYCIRESLLAVSNSEATDRSVPRDSKKARSDCRAEPAGVERSVGTAVDCSVLRGGGVARSGGVFKPTLT